VSPPAPRSDVKPENLLCSRVDGVDVVKLADFGSAVQLPPEGIAAVDPVAQGTTLYSPPEVLQGQAFSCTADIWAAGITT
jgi:serine/threonine protein kinase